MTKNERITKLERRTNALFGALNSLASMSGYQVRNSGNYFYTVIPWASGSDSDRILALADYLGVKFRIPTPSAKRVYVEKKETKNVRKIKKQTKSG